MGKTTKETPTLIAFCMFCSDALTTTINRLKRINSCLKTVFIDSSYLTGYFSITISISNGVGNLARMSAARSPIVSAGDFPAPDDWRGRVSRMLSNNYVHKKIIKCTHTLGFSIFQPYKTYYVQNELFILLKRVDTPLEILLFRYRIDTAGKLCANSVFFFIFWSTPRLKF